MKNETVNLISQAVGLIAEVSKRPGVMSLAGIKAEVKCRKELKLYFKMLGARIMQAHFEKLVDVDKETAKHQAEYKAKQIVRRSAETLQNVLRINHHEAFLVASKQRVVQEADSEIEVGPASGVLSSEAEDYAAEQAAKQIVGINQTTVDAVAELVAMSVGNQMTPADLSRDLRDLVSGWSKDRADTIARTEMADAFGEAALRKLKREEIEYKQLIPSPDACPVCLSIVDAGPVPVDQPFVDEDGEEYDRSPIHVNCRCATVGARAPEGE